MLSTTRPDAIAAVRSLFAASGFGGEGVSSLLRVEGNWAFGPRQVPVHLRRLAADVGALATLVRLFVLSAPVGPAEAEAALGDGLSRLGELGLLAEAGGALRGTVRIVPCDDLLIVSDLPRSGPDHVAGVHRPSATLQSLTVRRPVARALDVGTGNGIQALVLAAHAGRVVATDVNERALAFAEFNAALNGVSNVEWRAGSLLEPVAGERFGVVAANPPYVISPESELVFRDSGLGRDRVSMELVRGLPAVLEAGGFASVLISWIADVDDLAAGPRRWVEGSGCDAWLFHTAVEEPLTAAASWNAEVEEPDAFEQQLDRWTAYYRDEEIDAIGYGALVLRRREGDNWFHAVELPEGPRNGPPHVELLFRAQDDLAAAGDLLDAAVVPAAHTDFEHVNRSGPEGWQTAAASLVAARGIPFRAGLDGHSAALVAALEPGRRVREVVAAAAAARGVPPAEYEPRAVELLRRMVELGFLEVVAAPPAGSDPATKR